MTWNSRLDTHTVQVIRRGIEIDNKHGCAIAWAHMAAHGVPPETILRVLTKPQARRVADDRVADGALQARGGPG
ncbi:hypothetical protein [Pseudoduganella namucuonensis]|uniref:Uncharacterized protein n=1 Tax=Pseudoduganella namucuonensis TaxID=1035707 RepID=A0A1I7K0S0_9BURK|nr:hypothetical protein [Pseudoduganella namucuonensis]SFU91022.1 hypothetical protein SAMN05216552_101452 [Pseudoduganella namucuonensis]